MNTKRFDVDVLVAGGGVAGVSTALTAARGGLRTMLLESQITLGGLATNGYVNGIAGMIEGNCREWLDRCAAKDGLIKRPHLPAIDPDKAKFALEEMLLEANVRILYGTHVIGTEVDGANITKVICYSKSGRMEVAARMFIDGTGDADVAASAGVPYEVGSADFAGLNMSTTMGFRMANVNMPAYQQANQTWMNEQRKKHKVWPGFGMLSELEHRAVEAGDLPYFIFPTALIYPVPGTPSEDADICVMTTHSFHTRNDDVEDLTRQIIEQHQQIQFMEKFFKKYVPGFEKSRIIGLGNLHGVRDSRRIVGEYVLKDEDVACAAKFEDGIAKFPEFFDTHHPTSAELGFLRHIHLKEPKDPAICRPAQCDAKMHPYGVPGGYEARVNPLDYCDIPYRSLVPLKIDNLLVVGRCVSAEFNAIAAVRVIGLCMSTGQAAGAAAVLCLQNGVTPRQLDGKLVRKALVSQGVEVDKAPSGHWADVKQHLKGEFVVVPGDFVGVMGEDGIVRTHM